MQCAAFEEKQLRVEYELSDAAYGLLPAFRELLNWPKLYGQRGGPTSLHRPMEPGQAIVDAIASLAQEPLFPGTDLRFRAPYSSR